LQPNLFGFGNIKFAILAVGDALVKNKVCGSGSVNRSKSARSGDVVSVEKSHLLAVGDALVKNKVCGSGSVHRSKSARSGDVVSVEKSHLLAVGDALVKNKVCGSGSVVEHLLAKERVASSNLVFRSIIEKQERGLLSLFLVFTLRVARKSPRNFK
jgi:hypothetical protein